MINFIIITIIVLITAFVWYRVGRRDAHDKYAKSYSDLSEKLRSTLIQFEHYRNVYGEIGGLKGEKEEQNERITFEIIEQDSCNGCYFNRDGCCIDSVHYMGESPLCCTKGVRQDGRDVIFKLMKNDRTNQ